MFKGRDTPALPQLETPCYYQGFTKREAASVFILGQMLSNTRVLNDALIKGAVAAVDTLFDQLEKESDDNKS